MSALFRKIDTTNMPVVWVACLVACPDSKRASNTYSLAPYVPYLRKKDKTWVWNRGASELPGYNKRYNFHGVGDKFFLQACINACEKYNIPFLNRHLNNVEIAPPYLSILTLKGHCLITFMNLTYMELMRQYTFYKLTH